MPTPVLKADYTGAAQRVGQDHPASNWYESLTLDPACIDAGYARPKPDTVGALASCIPRNIRLVVWIAEAIL